MQLGVMFIHLLCRETLSLIRGSIINLILPQEPRDYNKKCNANFEFTDEEQRHDTKFYAQQLILQFISHSSLVN